MLDFITQSAIRFYAIAIPFHCQRSDIIWAKKSVFDLTQSNLSDIRQRSDLTSTEWLQPLNVIYCGLYKT